MLNNHVIFTEGLLAPVVLLVSQTRELRLGRLKTVCPESHSQHATEPGWESLSFEPEL